MKRIPLKSILAGMLLLVVSRIQTTVAFQGIAEPSAAVDIRFNPASIRAGTSFAVTMSGSNISDRTYVDLRFRTPGSAVDQFALNWQRGTTTIHEAPASTAAGFWLVTGIGVHDNADDHTGTIIPVSVVLMVEQFPALITTVAGDGRPGFRGDGGTPNLASLNFPGSIAVDSSGNLFVADLRNQRVRKIARDGSITTVAGNGEQGFSGDGGLAVRASLNLMGTTWTQYTGGVAVDSSGNIFIADTNNNRIRRVAPNGVIATIAGNGTRGYSGDGGSALEAALSGPGAIAADSIGNLFIADTGNNAIRKVTADGTIGTYVRGPFVFPTGVAVDANENVYIASRDDVLRVSPQGTFTAFRSGWSVPWGLTVDPVGNVYIADSHNQRIKKISPDGVVSTLAGIGELDPLGEVISPGYSGDGGLAANAALAFPLGVAVDARGNLYIADAGNNRIRKIGDP